MGDITWITTAQKEAKDAAALASIILIERDNRIAAAQNRVDRHNRELAMRKEKFKDDDKAMAAIYQYIQDLSDLPEQPGFPKNITWPVLAV
jgi:hypothetical protein